MGGKSGSIQPKDVPELSCLLGNMAGIVTWIKLQSIADQFSSSDSLKSGITSNNLTLLIYSVSLALL
jgi:hypothetical protein